MVAPSDGSRKVTWLGDKAADGGYCDNKVTTSKYTCLNFVPKNLSEQLHKFGNCYFLVISLVMYIGERTPLFVGTIKAFSTLATLLMMMGVSAIMALLDDYRRAAADTEINRTPTSVVETSSSGLKETTWQDVAVGDVMVVREGDGFPADVVPLYCCSEEGTCFVSTANLDGETNLKTKSSLSDTQELLHGGLLDSAETVVARLLSKESIWRGAAIEAEAPNVSIYTFNGKISLPAKNLTKALGADQLLLRGTVLRNTKFVIGVVVYTGADTRMVRNSRPPPMKMSNLEQSINQVMYVVLVAQAALAILSDVLFMMNKEKFESLWYLYSPEILLPTSVAYFLTFFVLYSNLMPISLYPTLEVCNAAQSYFIKNDLKMYYQDMDFPAGVRSSNLCQEIGQVNYIFSDKTGTLTQNVMELKRLSIKGRKYGEMTDASAVGFSDVERVKADPSEDIDTFLEVVAVCHTVMAEEGPGQTVKYEAESPDEAALVAGARDLGWEFRGRDRQDMVVMKRREARASPKECKYMLHAVNAFNSTRKRMSAVVQDPEGKFHLFIKGADNVMMERAQKGFDYNPDLDEFSRQGLRTLLYGRKALSSTEAQSWLARYEAASQQITDREGALDRVALEIEKDVQLVGATAIEDKLQVGVPECIELIRKAGIKLWILTGDKLETARNIGFSAKVLTDEMEIETIDVDRGASKDEVSKKLRKVVDDFQKLADREEEDERDTRKSPRDKFKKDKACLVTGAALEKITAQEDLKDQLLRVAELCSIVIACRVSPLQKAEMVKLVREKVTVSVDGGSWLSNFLWTNRKPPITLAIGDGANDVPMIQEAQVGVGIAGKEGRQAVNNSDFSIGQFRYLKRLLVVHGRWNYRRVCKFTLFTFWRNAVQVLQVFWFSLCSGYSGTCLFEDWIRLSFNFLCSVPIMATGCFDQDLADKVVLQHPELYIVGRERMDLHAMIMGETLISACMHSMALGYLTYKVAPAMDMLQAGDYYTYGTTAYTLLLTNTNVRVLALNYTHNLYTIGTFVLSFILYFIYLLLYPCVPFVANLLTPNMYMVPWHMLKVPFAVCLFAVPAVAMTWDLTVQTFYVYVIAPWTTSSHKQRTLAVYKRRHAYFEQELRKRQNNPDVPTGVDFVPPARCIPKSPWFPCLLHPAWPMQWKVPQSKAAVSHTLYAQQRHRGWQLRSPAFFVSYCSLLAAVILSLLAAMWWAVSKDVNQIRIPYAGTRVDNENELGYELVIDKREECGDSCRINVEVPFKMEPPILVYYEVAPFYQNHNFYLKSEVFLELTGSSNLDAVESLRERNCVEPTRVRDGKDIVPCGMKATSLFNDTFAFVGAFLNTENLAWASDNERYANPPDYPERPDTTWLYQLFPSMSSLKAAGVEDERFQVWMRPSAFSRVSNPIGRIMDTLEKGHTFSVSINSVFPLPEHATYPAYKSLVITELSSVGGRSDFCATLWSVAAVCFVCFLVATCAAARNFEQEQKEIDAVDLSRDSRSARKDAYESDDEDLPPPLEGQHQEALDERCALLSCCDGP